MAESLTNWDCILSSKSSLTFWPSQHRVFLEKIVSHIVKHLCLSSSHFCFLVSGRYYLKCLISLCNWSTVYHLIFICSLSLSNYFVSLKKEEICAIKIIKMAYQNCLYLGNHPHCNPCCVASDLTVYGSKYLIPKSSFSVDLEYVTWFLIRDVYL